MPVFFCGTIDFSVLNDRFDQTNSGHFSGIGVNKRQRESEVNRAGTIGTWMMCRPYPLSSRISRRMPSRVA
jgi:hypothetical protein